MWAKSLVGLGTLLAIFLLIRNLLRGNKAKAPAKIYDAFEDVFKNSDYKASMNNWLLVSKMETAGWTSKLFVNGLNLWGMKRAKVRPNTQIPFTQSGSPGRDSGFLNTTAIASEVSGNNQWAKYSNLHNAVKDIILWMQYTKFPNRVMSLRDHVEEMKKRSYFVGEDVEEYLKKILAWEKRSV